MLTIIWLIISAMFFSGMKERTGVLQRLLVALLTLLKKDGHLISGAGLTAIAANIVASDQYMSIVLTSACIQKSSAVKDLIRQIFLALLRTTALLHHRYCLGIPVGPLWRAPWALQRLPTFRSAFSILRFLSYRMCMRRLGLKIVKSDTSDTAKAYS